jgi:PAS domain S-box-containing protein
MLVYRAVSLGNDSHGAEILARSGPKLEERAKMHRKIPENAPKTCDDSPVANPDETRPISAPVDSDCLQCLDVLLAFPRTEFPERGRMNPNCRGCYDILLGSLRTRAGSPSHADGASILMVGVPSSLSERIRALLDEAGASVSEAHHVGDAIDQFISLQPEVAILVQSPADSRLLMKRLLELDPEVLCVVAADQAPGAEIQLCQAAGAFAAFDPSHGLNGLADILDHALMVVAVQRDRRRLREQLVLERNSSRSTLLHLPLGLMTLDEEFKIITCNRSFELATGISRDNVTGLEHLLAVTMPDNKARADLLRAVQRSGDDGQPARASALPLVHAANGSLRLIDWHITPLPGETQTGAAFIVVLQDVTKERQLSHQVLQSERLAAIGEMAASVAHELKNPLAGLTGALDLLLDELPPQSDLVRIRTEVKNQLRRLNELAGDLLNFAKPVRVSPTKLRFRDVVQAITSALSHDPALEKVEIIEEGGHVPIWVDAVQFPMVLQNLVLNAAQSAGPEATIRVAAENKPGKVLITVEDDGDGIPSEVIDRIFTPFFTTKSKGTGLGLPICRKIVEAHGGEINASNRPQGGAVMALTVPVLADE